MAALIIQVEPESLTADALDLADSQVPIVPMAVAPAADPVSQGVAAVLEAHSGALTTLIPRLRSRLIPQAAITRIAGNPSHIADSVGPWSRR